MSTPFLDANRSMAGSQLVAPACAAGVTYIPAELFDVWLPRLSGPALRVLLTLARATYGRRRAYTRLSLSHLQTTPAALSHNAEDMPRGCGVRQRGTLVDAISVLERLDLVTVERDPIQARRGVPHQYEVHLAPRKGAVGGAVAVPAPLIDEWMAELSDAELRVALYVCRRTWGWGKDIDVITISQFKDGIAARDGRQVDSGCGLRRPQSVYAALTALEKRGLVTSVRRRTPWGRGVSSAYRLTVESTAHTISSGGTGATHVRSLVRPAPDHWCASRVPAGVGTARQQDLRTQDTTLNTKDQDHHIGVPTPRYDDVAITCVYDEKSRPFEETHARGAAAIVSETVPEDVSVEARSSILPAVLRARAASIATELGARHAVLVQRRLRLLWHDTAGGDAAAVDAALIRAQVVTRERVARGDVLYPVPYLLSVCANLLRPQADKKDAVDDHADDTLDASAFSMGREADVPGDAGDPDWGAVLAVLRATMTRDNYHMWFATTRVLRRENRCLSVATRDAFHRDWLDHRLRPCIERALAEAASGWNVQFEVAAYDEDTAAVAS